MKKTISGISLIINTKNEENNILECIRSAKSIANEIVVVDMQSKDRTRAIANKNGARVYSVKDYGYVEPARNIAIQKARYEWVLILDADERVGPELLEKLKSIVKDEYYDVVEIPEKNIIFGKWIKHTGWWPDYHPRFHKKNSIRWPTLIHKQPIINGKLLKLPATEKYAITHLGISDISDFVEKTNRYTTVSQKYLKLKNADFGFFQRYIDGEFNYRYFDQEGFKDGTRGYVLSKLMEYYRFLEFVKNWESNNYPELFDNKDILKYLGIKNGVVKTQNTMLRINDLEKKLNIITSSKIYKIWQNYCMIRDKFILKK